MNTVTRLKMTLHQRQRGAVAITLGLTLVVLIGFVGLAIDLGRFFVIKAELQNAMDACALSAASQLKYGLNDTNALTRAEAYGKVFFTTDRDAVTNKVNFQSKVPVPAEVKVTFASSNAGPFKDAIASNPNEAKYVKCEYPLKDLPIYFMQVLNPLFTKQTVTAMAVAKRELPTASCIPVAVCKGDKVDQLGPPLIQFGNEVGDWLTAASDSPQYGSGHFGWINFQGDNGADDIAKVLTGSKQCDISQVGYEVNGQGWKEVLQKGWNTRFGLYWEAIGKGGLYSIEEAPPDKTGFAYSSLNENGTECDPLGAACDGNWPSGSNAYSGTAPTGQLNYIDARNVNQPYQGGVPFGIKTHQYKYIVTDPSVLNTQGRADRRLVVAPVVDCEIWKTPPSNQQVKVLDWACVLMLNPFIGSQPSDPASSANLEFLGLASNANSPCAGGEVNAIAPVLTQ